MDPFKVRWIEYMMERMHEFVRSLPILILKKHERRNAIAVEARLLSLNDGKVTIQLYPLVIVRDREP